MRYSAIENSLNFLYDELVSDKEIKDIFKVNMNYINNACHMNKTKISL